MSAVKDTSVQNAGVKVTVHQNINDHPPRTTAVTITEPCTLVNGLVQEAGVGYHKVIVGLNVEQAFTILIAQIWAMPTDD